MTVIIDRMLRCFLLIFGLVLVPSLHADERKPIQNPFFAMDTSFHRGATIDEELDLVKQLGFDGVCWTEAPVEQLKNDLASIDKHGLKLFAIYYAATVSPDGNLVIRPDLSEAMKLLKNHGTIIWLHFGGKGPAFDSLANDSAVVISIRKLADEAASHGLRIAVYPHIGEWTAHFADAIKLAKIVNHPAFGVTFNLCHALATGDEKRIPDLIREAGSSLFCVTLNGADTGVSGAQWDKLIQTLDKGSFDTHILLDALAENHFAGPIGFQGYGIKGDAKSILTPTMAAWKKLSK